jgi:hypothetical protein
MEANTRHFTDDRELLEGCLKQDRTAQKALYEKYAPRMFFYTRYVNQFLHYIGIPINGSWNLF